MIWRLRSTLFAAAALGVLAACDDDPSGVSEPLRLLACPAAPLDVNSPIALDFSHRLDPATITGANVVVSSALSGIEVPGGLVSADQGSGTRITFTPGEALTFGDTVRIRVQNLRAIDTNEPVEFAFCNIATAPPPITQLFWRMLPPATGSNITGVSVVSASRGFASAASGPIFRRDGDGQFAVVFSSPYFLEPTDVRFVDADHGYASYADQRAGRWRILESFNGGQSFDTLATAPAPNSIRRLFFRSYGPDSTDVFGVVGGGTSVNALFGKYDPDARSFTWSTLASSANVVDIDFASDTMLGAAAGFGIQLGSFFQPGVIYATTNGGGSWAEIPGTTAGTATIGYFGIAIRNNGEIWATGYAGLVLRIRPTGTGGFTVDTVLRNLVANPDVNQPNALIFTDIEFLRNNDSKGWLVGQVQTGVAAGTPRYRGFIFETTDGGTTWTQQGVAGAPNYGADFEALTRISAAPDGSAVWIGGLRGAVLEYQP